MKRKFPDYKRLLQDCAIILVMVLCLLYLALPAAVGVVAVYPSRVEVGAPPDDFAEITLDTDDNVDLQAWYHPPTNGAAIILLHGAGGTREDVRLYAQMLARFGFGVLALDLRGHGESGGTTNRFGWQGASDVDAAIKFLLTRDELFVEQVGERATLWVAPDAAHMGAYQSYPSEYEKRITGFFERELLSGSNGQEE